MLTMITTRNKLERILDLEFNGYFANNRQYYKALILGSVKILLWKYQKALRCLEYYKYALNQAKIKNHIDKFLIFNKLVKFFYICKYSILFSWNSRKVNVLGLKLGIDTWHGVFDEGLIIYHSAGGIVVNSKARIGKNCHLHGNNCIGNDGKSEEAPIIGNNCSLGVGAKVIGNIRIGDNITIAAGAVVIRDCLENGVMLAGIPAKIKRMYE